MQELLQVWHLNLLQADHDGKTATVAFASAALNISPATASLSNAQAAHMFLARLSSVNTPTCRYCSSLAVKRAPHMSDLRCQDALVRCSADVSVCSML